MYEPKLNGESFGQSFIGGQGRGEHSNLQFASGLNGDLFIASVTGGAGRGDIMQIVNASALNGDSFLSSVRGGPGRGDHFSLTDASGLNGDDYGGHYTGGLGRGDHTIAVQEISINGDLISPMYAGGIGRGEDEQISYAQILHCSYYALWTGLISNAWTNPNNWSCNTLPHRYSDVVIPSGVPNFPLLSGATVSIRNLTLLNNSQLHVQGVKLNVLGD